MSKSVDRRAFQAYSPIAINISGGLATDGGEKGLFVQRALQFVQNTSRSGFEGTQPPEFSPDHSVAMTSSGAGRVALQQQYKSIPIFQADQTVNFAPNGTLGVGRGNVVSMPRDMSVPTDIDVDRAFLVAAKHVAQPDAAETDPFGQQIHTDLVDLTGFVPEVIARFTNIAEQPTVFKSGPFGDEITASLTWFPTETNELTLAWDFLITMPKGQGQYHVLVDAKGTGVLFCTLVAHGLLARGSVHRVNAGTPRSIVQFPTEWTAFLSPDFVTLASLPAGAPDDWVDGSRSTAGNCVRAHTNEADAPFTGSMDGDGRARFEPADELSDEQKVVNLFYYNCVLHDFFYALGFRESDGNFQSDNFGRGGTAGDPVDARSFPGQIFMTANMSYPVDGASPIMNMGVVLAPANGVPSRHTAMDSSVVFHEFTHGVSNRLVGKKLNARALESPQSAGMGEGWSDYFACSMNNTIVIGDWVMNRPAGIRSHPYDSNYPNHFGNLGPSGLSDPHDVGEVWCAALLEMNRNIGKEVGLQLVIDAMKLSQANPSFLDMRDAILTAADHQLSANLVDATEHARRSTGIQRAFARFGMGPLARCSGSTLTVLATDFNAPDGPPIPPPIDRPPPPPSLLPDPTGAGETKTTAPNIAIPDMDPVGINSALAISTVGTVVALSVSVDIQHQWVGDLRISLISPDGRRAILQQDQPTFNAQSLVKTFSNSDTPAIGTLSGGSANGNWVLNVADVARLSVGTLRNWSLTVNVSAAGNSNRSALVSRVAYSRSDPGRVRR